jgi:ATP-dependent DNA helicase RecG
VTGVPPLALDAPVTEVARVGSRTADQLRSAFGIGTVRGLLEHYPRRYSDLGEMLPLGAAEVGGPVTLVGRIIDWTNRQARVRRRLTIHTARVRDLAGGGDFDAVFFNQPYRERQFPPGTVAAFGGTLEHRYGRLQISVPEITVIGPEGVDHQRLVPVYPATEQLPTWRIATIIGSALERLEPVPEHLPDEVRAQVGLMSYDRALRAIHDPDDRQEAEAARRRLVFDELFTLQVGLQWRRARLEAAAVGVDNRPRTGGLAERFVAGLPFEPTGAQRRAFHQLSGDLEAERPMHRLLQGDVGAGKTVVATWAMLCAVENGRQAAMMAPTEVLAEQHHRTLVEQLAPLGVNVLDGVRVELLTSTTTATERRRIVGELLSGAVDIVVGTHALLEEGVRFVELGVVVVDEQHRFGVSQRVRLREKGRDGVAAAAADPDVLVMTATPIPRSLALTFFGDLDVTELDELPPGRQDVRTELIVRGPEEQERRPRLYDFVRRQAAEGHRTYVVCPLVEPSTEVAAVAAEVEYRRLRDQVLTDLRVGLVHGRLPHAEKEAAMDAFRRGDLDVLVATTVIEVGVDVPEATVMIVESAERFGISQLHQLRGRVGRSEARGWCVLFADPREEEGTARERLEAVAATTDGFELAEKDLGLRGAGQLFGERQSGLPDLRIADLRRDGRVARESRQLAVELVASDPQLGSPHLAPLRAEVLRRFRGLAELDALATG